MESIINKISKILSLIVVFFFSAVFYFNYKGFTIDSGGNIVLQTQTASAGGRVNVLPKDINFNASTKFAVGSPNAPLTLYEISSLRCPHCADFHLEVVPELEKEYVEKGLLRIVFVNFPLDKRSMQASLVLQCATIDNYHPLLTRLMQKQRFWGLAGDLMPLHRYAEEYGISYEEAETCMKNDTMAQAIIADRQQGMTQLKMTGTPALLFSGKDGNEIIYSAVGFDMLKKYLDKRLTNMGALR